MKNIQLERHKNIKFDREIFARKIVKYSFVIEKFIKLSAMMFKNKRRKSETYKESKYKSYNGEKED